MSLTEEEFNRVKPMNFNQIVEKEPDLVERAIRESESVFEIMITLGVGPTNTSARKTLRAFAEMKKIDLPTGRSNPSFKKLTEEEFKNKYLVIGRYLGTTLRKYVLLFSILEYSCSNEKCLLHGIVNPTWSGEDLTLDLDHIDGNNKNNEVENLRFLCPNCHSQTLTYKGRNRKTSTSSSSKDICPKCKTNEKKTISMMCKACNYERVKSLGNSANYPEVSVILESISKIGVESSARQYGVSGNALKKYLNRRGFKVADYSPYSRNK